MSHISRPERPRMSSELILVVTPQLFGLRARSSRRHCTLYLGIIYDFELIVFFQSMIFKLSP